MQTLSWNIGEMRIFLYKLTAKNSKKRPLYVPASNKMVKILYKKTQKMLGENGLFCKVRLKNMSRDKQK